MTTIDLADPDANLSDLIELVETGGSIEITRHGKPVARLTGIDDGLKRINVDALRALTGSVTPQPESAVTFVRSMRDSDRY
jgi:prevent-host-death family protein